MYTLLITLLFRVFRLLASGPSRQAEPYPAAEPAGLRAVFADDMV